MRFCPDNAWPPDAWQLLSPQLTESRKAKLLRTVENRTQLLRLVVQDIHQPHNVSACIRSAEAFGVQDIHVVEMNQKFDVSTVARGVDRWVSIQRHKSVLECTNLLKKNGFVVASAFPTNTSITLEELPIDRPLALVFGNEHAGLDEEWRNHSDFCFTIPMAGIVESLNISVCAAVSLYSVANRMKASKSNSLDEFYLTKTRQDDLLNQWVCEQIPSAMEQLERLRTAK